MEGRRKVPLGVQRIADLPLCARQVALPVGISRVDSGEMLSDGVRGLVVVERHGEAALRQEHVSDLVVRDGQIALCNRYWTGRL